MLTVLDAAQAREILYLMNPNKIRVCEYLMRYHEARGDKIIIFSDSVFALQEYARLFNRPAIYGGTKEKDRENVLAVFRISATTNTILLSRVRMALAGCFRSSVVCCVS